MKCDTWIVSLSEHYTLYINKTLENALLVVYIHKFRLVRKQNE